MCLVNKTYHFVTGAISKHFFEHHPQVNTSVPIALIAITVLIEQRFLVTFVYLNIHNLLGLSKSCLLEALIIYLNYIEYLDQVFSSLYHIVQGDFNPTCVSEAGINQFHTELETLGFFKLPEYFEEGNNSLDWTWTNNIRTFLGGVCYVIFGYCLRYQNSVTKKPLNLKNNGNSVSVTIITVTGASSPHLSKHVSTLPLRHLCALQTRGI